MNLAEETKIMDRNPYDNSIDWLQPQSSVNRKGSLYTTPQQGSIQRQTQATTKKAASTKQARMPKQKALEIVSSLKKGIVVSSVMSFGLFGFLALGHTVGTPASTTKTTTPITRSSSSTPTPQSKATSTSTPQSKASTSSSPKSTASSSNSSSSNNSSSSTNQGGASFGTSSSQNSVSGTSVS